VNPALITPSDSVESTMDGAKTILVVDDQQDERAIQRAMLGHLGYVVREAESGAEGLKAAVDDPPDLVLLDVAMPMMDGFTVCRELRSDPRTADVRVLMFTASVTGDIGAEAEAAGADAILMKPVHPRLVAEEIRRLIGDPGPELGRADQPDADGK
jgi:CheY-like chemotaxis protein